MQSLYGFYHYITLISLIFLISESFIMLKSHFCLFWYILSFFKDLFTICWTISIVVMILSSPLFPFPSLHLPSPSFSSPPLGFPSPLFSFSTQPFPSHSPFPLISSLPSPPLNFPSLLCFLFLLLFSPSFLSSSLVSPSLLHGSSSLPQHLFFSHHYLSSPIPSAPPSLL